MAFSDTYQLGQIAQQEPVQTVIGAMRTGTGIAALTASKSAGGLVLGLSSLSWAGIGLALAAIGAVYAVIKARINKSRAKEKARQARITAFNQLGVNLIDQVYGMQIPGWTFPVDPTVPTQYYQLGVLFYNWSKRDPKDSAEICSWLKTQGLEPTRFVGADNVYPGTQLDYERDYVAEPEKFLVAKEALRAIGYIDDQFQNLPFKWFVRFFDIVMAIPTAYHELQAQMIKADLEYHLKSAGLDPHVMWTTVLPSETLPPAVYEVYVEPETKEIRLETEIPKLRTQEEVLQEKRLSEEEKAKESVSIAGLSPSILVLFLALGVLVFSKRKESPNV